MNLQKKPRIENELYLKWVETLDCKITGAPADDAHHRCGQGGGGMGTKPHDFLAMPLTRGSHTLMHNDPGMWIDQNQYILETIEEAFRQGVIVFDNKALKELSK